jgi:PKD repeat protein
MSNTKNTEKIISGSWVVESRSDKSVNIKDYSIEKSFSPEVDEVYIEREGKNYTIYLTSEKGESMELNLHTQEFEIIRKAMNRIADLRE